MYHKIAEVKQHIRENKKVYIASSATFICGGVAAVVFMPRNIQIVDAMNLKLWSPTTSTVVTVIERRACMDPILVRCKETGEIFGSIRRAGDLLEIPRSKIAQQLAGTIPDAGGLTFETVLAK